LGRDVYFPREVHLTSWGFLFSGAGVYMTEEQIENWSKLYARAIFEDEFKGKEAVEDSIGGKRK
jgi:hypothetical protein